MKKNNGINIQIRPYEKCKEGIFLFGAGVFGNEFIGTLKEYQCFLGYIDNDPVKIESGYHGERVMAFSDYMTAPRGFIVITAAPKNQKQIVKQLLEAGLKENIDFCCYETFSNEVFPRISYFCYQKVFLSLAQITLTERCTLKCEKCAHACFNVKSTQPDMTIEEAKKSADEFFAHIDYIQEFVLIGGEPLLYANLQEIISYVGKHYRKQMNIFSITSNGTILPDEKVLAACRKYDVLYRISNYEKQIPYLKEKYEKLLKRLSENGVAYRLGKAETTWMDYGFESLDRKASEEELIAVFDQCKTPCREVRGNKLYFCVMARSVSDNLHYGVGQDDYLDLDKLDPDKEKMELLEFNLGYSEKGYLDMCQHCNGKEAENYPIPAAVQVKKGSKYDE